MGWLCKSGPGTPRSRRRGKRAQYPQHKLLFHRCYVVNTNDTARTKDILCPNRNPSKTHICRIGILGVSQSVILHPTRSVRSCMDPLPPPTAQLDTTCILLGGKASRKSFNLQRKGRRRRSLPPNVVITKISATHQHQAHQQQDCPQLERPGLPGGGTCGKEAGLVTSATMQPLASLYLAQLPQKLLGSLQRQAGDPSQPTRQYAARLRYLT